MGIFVYWVSLYVIFQLAQFSIPNSPAHRLYDLKGTSIWLWNQKNQFLGTKELKIGGPLYKVFSSVDQDRSTGFCRFSIWGLLKKFIYVACIRLNFELHRINQQYISLESWDDKEKHSPLQLFRTTYHCRVNATFLYEISFWSPIFGVNVLKWHPRRSYAEDVKPYPETP